MSRIEKLTSAQCVRIFCHTTTDRAAYHFSNIDLASFKIQDAFESYGKHRTNASWNYPSLFGLNDAPQRNVLSLSYRVTKHFSLIFEYETKYADMWNNASSHHSCEFH
jgi:hypothetical protein